MMSDDAVLVMRSVKGDERAFVELIRRYEQPLATLIRYQVEDPDHAEDVWQDTLLHAWTALKQIRKPHEVRAWLLQVARNRCRAFYRSRQRRDRPMEDRTLEQIINRYGYDLFRQRETADEALDALDAVPVLQRDIARLFYLEGLTIAEIAARHRLPTGTVKRRLFGAREHMRQTLGVVPGARRTEMDTHTDVSKPQPFPDHRPEIVITPIRMTPFTVDCRELRWWHIVPEVGDRTITGAYDPPEWVLTGVTEAHAITPARIHDVEGVEITIDEWKRDGAWEVDKWTMYGRLTETSAQWLATVRNREGNRELRTYLDEGFDEDWGAEIRRLEDSGRFVPQPDGSLRQENTSPEASGAGMFSVTIGDRNFTCLRILGVEAEPDEHGILMEAYITQDGRSVLIRRYNGRLWARRGDPPYNWGSKPSWEEELPDNIRLVIDGVTFVHWYDHVSGMALGV